MLRRGVLAGLASTAGLSLTPIGTIASAQQSRPGRWLRLESANFIVFSAVAEGKTREELFALEAFHALLARLMPREARSALKLTVYMTGSSQDFDRIAPWADPEVLGFYSTSVEEVRAVSTAHKNAERQRDTMRNVRALDARTVLFHEYTHHFVMANSHAFYPPWYIEGIAEFLSTVDFAEDGVLVGKFTTSRAIWLTVGDWLNITAFLTKNPSSLSSDDRAQFYAQAWLATHYLFNNTERARGFDKYVKALHAGGDPWTDFEPAFGISPAAFDKELRDYKKKSMQFVKLGGVTVDRTIPIAAERLPAAADDLLMPTSYLRNVPAQKLTEKTLRILKAEAKKHENDAFAVRSRALAEVWYGDIAEARKLLDGLMVSDGKNAETLHLSGLCDLRAGYVANDSALFKRARGAFAAAHRIDGTRANSLFRYVESCLHEQGSVDDHLLEVLMAAYQLAPQVDEFVLAAAQGLMEHKRFVEAAAILRPLTADAHDSDTRVAHELLAAAQAERLPAAFVFPGSARTVEQDDP